MKTLSLLDLVMELRLELQLGQSVAQSLRKVLVKHTDFYSQNLNTWLERVQVGQKNAQILKQMPELTATAGRLALITVLERGLNGTPIHELLQQLEDEFLRLAEDQYERHLQTLPLKLLFPLMVFILPAIMLMVLGPVIFILESQF